MNRKHLALVAALVLAVAGSAHAVQRPAAGHGRHGRRRVRRQGLLEDRAAAVEGAASAACTPPATSSTPTPRRPRWRWQREPPATAKVPCYGDGQSGPRVQMVYGYHQGLPNRAAVVAKQLRTEMAPRMQAVINAQSLGEDLGIRFAWTKGCGAIDLKVVKFPVSVQNAHRPARPGRPAPAGDHPPAVDRDGPRGPQVPDPLGRLERRCLRHRRAGRRDRPHLAPAGTPERRDCRPSRRTTDLGGVVAARRAWDATKYSMVFNHAGGKTGPSCFNTQGHEQGDPAAARAVPHPRGRAARRAARQHRSLRRRALGDVPRTGTRVRRRHQQQELRQGAGRDARLRHGRLLEPRTPAPAAT